MKIHPKHGIDQLLFGMKQADVTAIYGKPDKEFADDDENKILVYNAQKWRLTFYHDEDYRLGYIISSNPELTLSEMKVIGVNVDEIKTALQAKGFKTWEQEDFDISENHFNEANWTILLAEFGEIVKVELGAIISDDDEFDWKFN